MCRMIFHVYIGCHRFSRSQFSPGITTLFNNSASRPGSTPQAQRFPLPWHTFLARRVQRALHARIDGVIFTRFFGAWRDSLVLGGVGIMTTVNVISWGNKHLITVTKAMTYPIKTALPSRTLLTKNSKHNIKT